MEMHLGLVSVPEDGAEADRFMAFREFPPDRNRRHLFRRGADDVSPPPDAADDAEAGRMDLLVPADVRQSAKQVVTVMEAGDDDSPRSSYLILHGRSSRP